MYIDEYVPNIIPISKVTANPCNASPPNKKSERTTSVVAKLVSKVRRRVSFILILTISSIDFPDNFTIFSLIRANITIVSLIE